MKATSEELTIFVAVVESGSFSRAAEQLGQANSAISRSVKKLEMKLGVSLLNRTTRQLSLTEEGERYFAACSRYCRRWRSRDRDYGDPQHAAWIAAH
jgi:DNA-binding transcriptional LysR family regulator